MYTLKKSLGQHFLRDDGVSLQIVDALTSVPFTRLLEVGPGGGALTKHLLKLQDIDLKCVEIDEEKVAFLLKTYPVLNGKIISNSILDMNAPFEEDFTVVGNFPYNISSQILFKILDWMPQVERMVGMFQKEVAQRISSPEGSKVYGVVSVFMQAYFDVQYLFDVPATAFDPPPKVVSGVIMATRKTTPVKIRSKEKFFMLVKTAFIQRRKTLRNAVRGIFDGAVLEDPIFDRRAEQLSVREFADLTFKMR
jgi:16S rRNA (adenine1518-N6/adenine1519-N6)-dimethyltransferase